MARAFNMGIGMIVVVPDHAVLDVMQRIEALKERAYVIGEILDCKEAGRRLIWD
jgi:phosphoribosylformylglycinamidine cyclo-ligase